MIATNIAPESPDQPEIVAMLAASDRYHAGLYPQESNHLVDVADLLRGNVRFWWRVRTAAPWSAVAGWCWPMMPESRRQN